MIHRVFLSVLVGLMLAVRCRADSWIAPSVKVIASPDGSALLRILPGHAGENGGHATATVLKYNAVSKGYENAMEFALRNPIAPRDAVITNGAQFIVTFDDWGEVGRTDNVVVVYRSTGEVVKSWSLVDIFSPDEIKKFASSVSSTWWRDGIELIENRTQNPIVIIRPEARSTPQNDAPVLFDIGKLTFRKRG